MMATWSAQPRSPVCCARNQRPEPGGVDPQALPGGHQGCGSRIDPRGRGVGPPIRRQTCIHGRPDSGTDALQPAWPGHSTRTSKIR